MAVRSLISFSLNQAVQFDDDSMICTCDPNWITLGRTRVPAIWITKHVRRFRSVFRSLLVPWYRGRLLLFEEGIQSQFLGRFLTKSFNNFHYFLRHPICIPLSVKSCDSKCLIRSKGLSFFFFKAPMNCDYADYVIRPIKTASNRLMHNLSKCQSQPTCEVRCEYKVQNKVEYVS